MTINEFKAWFDGFSEGIKKAPTPKQWERIQERVGEIDGAAPTVIYDYPYRPWWPNWYPGWTWTNDTTDNSEVFRSTTFTTLCANEIGKQEAARLEA